MKLLINGYTVSEQLEIRIDKKYWDLGKKIIDHIKQHSNIYFYTVYIASLLFNLDFIFYPNDLVYSFYRVGRQLLDLLLYVVKWEFLWRGMQGIVSLLFNRCNPLKTSLRCVRNLIGFLFIEYYPKLVDVLNTFRVEIDINNISNKPHHII